MGKGIAKRKRKQRAEKANSSNLFKAQFGKASAFAPLPEAPKPEDFRDDKLPASLRKLMQLKDAATKQEARKQAQKEKAHQASQQAQPAAASKEQPLEESQPQQQQQTQHQGSHNAPGAEAGKGQRIHKQDGQPGKQQLPAQQQQQQQQASKPGKAYAEERIYKEGAFDTAKPKRLKDKKREFLERKKQRKKAGHGAADESGPTPAELKLKMQQAATQAQFGEVADAPLKVQLKRKHWATQQQQQQPDGGAGVGAGDASRSSTRLTAIFKQQMAAAQQRMAAPGKPGEGAPPAKKQKHKQQPSGGASQVGLLAQARRTAAAAAAVAQREKLRQQVVAAYRQQKQGSQAGNATMQSLAALVKKNAVGDAAVAGRLR